MPISSTATAAHREPSALPSDTSVRRDTDTTGKKRGRVTADEGMQAAGRGIRKLVSLFTPVSAIVYEFDRRNKMVEDGLDEPATDPTDKKAMLEKKDRDRNFKSFNELAKLVPGLLELISEEGPTGPKARTVYRELQEGANSARSCDTHRIKCLVADWLNSQESNPPTPPLTRTKCDDRGIQNDTTGRLLCSISLDWDDEQ
ncbi:hypothetical protein BJ322DRAFT_1016714 [Thelephora terrestris]|uniref:Uncharacterized protein n=1 Tax=Thelephora terrestris TaxID=56493 RepID=A0A9P6LC79_9AGAM|nr:hypothetical protein BJ322DRAFT_1016714 [Thelephora terrestris]